MLERDEKLNEYELGKDFANMVGLVFDEIEKLPIDYLEENWIGPLLQVLDESDGYDAALQKLRDALSLARAARICVTSPLDALCIRQCPTCGYYYSINF